MSKYKVDKRFVLQNNKFTERYFIRVKNGLFWKDDPLGIPYVYEETANRHIEILKRIRHETD
jgi:hypothetical protein